MSSRKFFYGLLVAAGLLGYAADASAQQCRQIILPNGTVLTCDVDASGQKVYLDTNGVPYPATTGGIGQFTVVNGTSNPCTAELAVTNIDLTSTNPTLGTIRTRLDPTRPSSLSRIRSNQIGSDFPATEDIYFQARATLSSQPGKLFRSINELHFNSQQVLTFNPHVNEVFRLVNRVAFEDVQNPGVVAFVLDQATVRLNGKRQ